MNEREAGLVVVIAPVMSCGYHVSSDSDAGFILDDGSGRGNRGERKGRTED